MRIVAGADEGDSSRMKKGVQRGRTGVMRGTTWSHNILSLHLLTERPVPARALVGALHRHRDTIAPREECLAIEIHGPWRYTPGKDLQPDRLRERGASQRLLFEQPGQRADQDGVRDFRVAESLAMPGPST